MEAHDPEKCVGCALTRVAVARYGEGGATVEQVGALMDDIAETTAHIVASVENGAMIFSLMLAGHLRSLERNGPPPPDDGIHADMSVKH